jgi:hypothetical protein
LSYGSREEIVNAVKNICNKVKNNTISIDSIDDSIINEHLYTQNLPEVDLLIRTSGEHRISNFLLWQIAYAELYFTDVLWPDFKEQNLYEAIISYQKRERRFGKQVNKLNNFLVLNKSIKAVLTLLILGSFHKLKLKFLSTRHIADVVLTNKISFNDQTVVTLPVL